MRAGIRAVLEADDLVEVVGEASGQRQGVEQINSLVPDVALVGMRLDDGSGFDTCRQVRDEQPSVRTLVLTGFPGPDALRSAVLAGASGVLAKSIGAERLLEAVVAVAGGANLIDTHQLVGLIEREPDVEQAVASLTGRERDILSMVGEGLTNREIGERLFLVEKTVRNHVTRLLAKLGVRSRTQAALVAARLRR